MKASVRWLPAASVVLLGLHGVDTHAVVVSPANPVTVTQSYAYTTYNGGDFVFSTSVAAAGCSSGWYLKASDPGYKAAVGTILTAQSAGLQIVVYGETTDLWSGSPSGQYCHAQAGRQGGRILVAGGCRAGRWPGDRRVRQPLLLHRSTGSADQPHRCAI